MANYYRRNIMPISPEDPEYYNLTFNANGGEVYCADPLKGPAATIVFEDIREGTDFVIPLTLSAGIYFNNSGNGNEGSSITKYFAGWSESAGGSAYYQRGSSVHMDRDKTLYAIWVTNTFTVDFTDGYSGRVLKSEEVEYGGSATPPSDPVRDGYIFMGWDRPYTDVKSNLTVNALWLRIPIYIMTSNHRWEAYLPSE